MQVVNRSAIVIKPKEPYLSWANDVGQCTETLDELRRQSTVILVPVYAYSDRAREYLRKNFRRIFEIELEGWSSNKKLWPPVKDYDVFAAWFDVEVFALVLDGEDKLLKEPYQ